MEHRTTKKYCILHSKCSHFTGKYKDLRAMIHKHMQKKEEFQHLQKEQERTQCSNWLFKSLSRTLKGGKQKKSSNVFRKFRFLTMKVKRVSPTQQKEQNTEKSHPLTSNEIQAWTKYLLHVLMIIVKIKQENKLKITWIFLLILV